MEGKKLIYSHRRLCEISQRFLIPLAFRHNRLQSVLCSIRA